MKIGLIQVRGIGDILIALPIARWYMERGHQICWPIDAAFIGFLSSAAPDIDFMPVVEDKAGGHLEFYYHQPRRLLEAAGCEQIVTLYSYLSDADVAAPKLADSLSFDQYKYAVAGVPFDRKWTCRIERDRGRELALFNSLRIEGEYIVIHSRGHDALVEAMLPAEWKQRYRLIHISELTDNPFDWIHTLEHAAKLVLLESGFSNLVELLDIGREKYLLLHSPAQWTPVYKNGWQFVPAFEPIVSVE